MSQRSLDFKKLNGYLSAYNDRVDELKTLDDEKKKKRMEKTMATFEKRIQQGCKKLGIDMPKKGKDGKYPNVQDNE